MLFSLQMQPIMSHVPQRLLARSFGQTARPKASPKCLQDSRLRPAFVTQMLEDFEPRPTWLSTGSGPRPECFPPRTGTSNIFSPEYTGGIQKHGALLLHSWIQEAPLKGLAGGDFGIYIGKNTIASNGRQASKAPGGFHIYIYIFKMHTYIQKYIYVHGHTHKHHKTRTKECNMT